MRRVQEIWSNTSAYNGMIEDVDNYIDSVESQCTPMELLKGVLKRCVEREFSKYSVNVEVRNGVRILLKDSHTTEDAFKLLSDMLNYIITCEPFNRSQECMTFIQEFSFDVIRGIKYLDEWRRYYAPVYGIDPDAYNCGALFVPYPPLEKMIMENENDFLMTRIEGEMYISPAEFEDVYLSAKDKADVEVKSEVIFAMQRNEYNKVLNKDTDSAVEEDYSDSDSYDEQEVSQSFSDDRNEMDSVKSNSVSSIGSWGKRRLTLARVQEILDAKKAQGNKENASDNTNMTDTVCDNSESTCDSDDKIQSSGNSINKSGVHSEVDVIDDTKFSKYYDLWKTQVLKEIESKLAIGNSAKPADFSSVKFVQDLDYLYSDVANTLSKRGKEFKWFTEDELIASGDKDTLKEYYEYRKMVDEMPLSDFSTRLIAKQKGHEWGKGQEIIIPRYDLMSQSQMTDNEFYCYTESVKDDISLSKFAIPDLLDFYLFQYRVRSRGTKDCRRRKCAFQFTIHSLLQFVSMELFDFRKEDIEFLEEFDIKNLLLKLQYFCTLLKDTKEVRSNSYLSGQVSIWQMRFGLDTFRFGSIPLDLERIKSTGSYGTIFNEAVSKLSSSGGNFQKQYAFMLYIYHLIHNDTKNFWSDA